jgi:cbb3-type cytochrome oxidase subunit 3
VNPLRIEAATNVEMVWLMGVMTVFFLVCFSFWTWYAYSRKNRKYLEEAALLPLAHGDDP